MTTVRTSPREIFASSSANSESREDTLKRQLLEKRQARLAAKLPAKPEAQPEASSSAGGPFGGMSIKGKGKEKVISLKDRIGGMRAWDEVPAQPVEVIEVAQMDDESSSSLAYPRTRSPSPRRSRSPLPRRRERDRSAREDSERGRGRSSVSPSPPPRRSRSPSPRRRDQDRSSPPPRSLSPAPGDRNRDTSSYARRSRSPLPYRRRDDRSPIRRRSPSRSSQGGDRLPNPPPRRTFDNPDRLAMRQGNHGLPPHPHRSNGHPPIHAEPMRGPDRPDQRERRQSPSYKPYERPPYLNGAGTGDGGYGYGAGRRDLGPVGPPGAGQRGQGGGGWQNPPGRHNGPVNFEQRRIQREQSNVIAWPASPEHPYRDEAEIEADRRAARKASKSKSKSKQSKHRSRYSSASSSESSESEDDRRYKRHKREKRRKYASSDSESAAGENRRRKSKSKSKSRARSMVAALSGGEDEWLEKESKVKVVETPMSLEDLRKLQQKKKEEEEEIGPVLPGGAARVVQRQPRYEDMRPGEAEAMALYASNGMRIPRRGEIGIDTGRIETLEDSGYVMSGARNKKMNAMRLRKENQVISAEEKRAILNLQREEKIKREGMIVSQFRELMNTAVQRQE